MRIKNRELEILSVHHRVLGVGRDNNSVIFDVKPDEFSTDTNAKTGATEKVFKGDVDLKDCNLEFN